MASASASSKPSTETNSVAPADKEESTASDKESEQDQSQNTESNENHQKSRSKQADSTFPEHVFKRLSRINGAINKMTKSELLKKVHDLQLDSRGNKGVLQKRLKMYYKKHRLRAVNSSLVKETGFEFLIVIDFEATCTPYNVNFKHEIIEFPIILIDVQQKKIVDKFHAYCKPTINPQLTKFCIELTGITQETVNNAQTFPLVMSQALQWLLSKGLLTSVSNSSHRRNKFAIVTDGPWDMGRFLYYQCQYSGVQFPRWARRWINIRRRYESFYSCKKVGGLKGMLEMMGMSFEGQLHCGLDDAYNIARIALRLMADGCCLKINEYLNAPIVDVSSSSSSTTAAAEGSTSVSAAQSNSEDSDSLMTTPMAK
ncbi:3'-5' exoribonuclease 1 [Octopus sinensis]|uniref:3'-5' exoribonuclease 1 n=1 Tax=Octopus sinensis TaxID=2607531 RepID=A0A6P7T2H9_9MOLL|nr:3'-5' exoribonuclease 1 [Octopus sinensis]